jgi:hypothetical protein
MTGKFETHYCVPDENEYLIAELRYGNEHWAELNTEQGMLQLVVFPRASGEPWRMSFADAIEALSNAELQIKKRSVFFDNAT